MDNLPNLFSYNYEVNSFHGGQKQEETNPIQARSQTKSDKMIKKNAGALVLHEAISILLHLVTLQQRCSYLKLTTELCLAIIHCSRKWNKPCPEAVLSAMSDYCNTHQ